MLSAEKRLRQTQAVHEKDCCMDSLSPSLACFLSFLFKGLGKSFSSMQIEVSTCVTYFAKETTTSEEDSRIQAETLILAKHIK